MALELDDKNQMALTLHDLTAMNCYRGDWAQMRNYAEQYLVVSRELGDKMGITEAFWALGESLSRSGDFETGRKYLEQALEFARTEAMPNVVAFALDSLAWLARSEGDNTGARALLMECAEIRRQIGHRSAVAGSLIDLGQLLLQEGDFIQPKALAEESLAISRELKIIRFQVYCLAGFASAAGNAGQDARAAILFGATEAAAERLALKMDDFDHMTYDPIVAAVRGRVGEADFDVAWARGRKLTLEQALEYAQEPNDP